MHLFGAENLIAVLDLNFGGRFGLTVYMRFQREQFFGRDFRRGQNVFDPNIPVRPCRRRNCVHVDSFRFQTCKHVHHPAGIFITITEQHEPLQMMRRETADGAVNCVFDIRSALVDRAAGCCGCDLNFFELVELVENSGIRCEGDEARVIGMACLVRLLNPLNRRLDRRRRDALGNIEEVYDGNPCSRSINHRLHQRKDD